MNIAILSVSKKGKELSSRLKLLLDEDPTIIKVSTFHKNVKDNLDIIFNNKNYDAIIGIMATGILIRSIADKIQDKTRDPAIVSIDDNGNHVVSLVSGHLGGANELTKKIAKLIGSEAVISTATDNNNKIGIDTLATKLQWEIINKNQILFFNKAILEEKPIKLYINLGNRDKIEYIDYIKDYLKNQENNTLEIIDIKNTKLSKDKIIKDIFTSDISNKTKNKVQQDYKDKNYQDYKDKNYQDYNDEDYQLYNDYNIIATFDNHKMFFKPRKIVLGIGARANISKDKILTSIKTAMNNLNLAIERIDYIATAEIKKDEKGILDAVTEINKNLEIVTINEIKNFKSEDISSSDFVKENFDIPGVAEPTALIVAKKISNDDSKLIHKKIAVDGVTVAVAVSK